MTREGSVVREFVFCLLWTSAWLSLATSGMAMEGRTSEGMSPDGIWQIVEEQRIPAAAGARLIRPSKYQALRLEESSLKAILQRAPMELTEAAEASPLYLTLPLADGGFEWFRVVESPIMEPPLAARFPEIRTYAAQGVDDATATARLDWTPAGFHAIIFSATGTAYVDPYRRGDTSHYISYRKRDFVAAGKQFACWAEGRDETGWNWEGIDGPALAPSGTQLRTYRAAVACTGEYAAYHGGTVPGALSAITTTMNRVVGVYEREVAVRMVLIANETSIIYTNGSTDPYTNNNGSTMLGQNQTNLDSVIGSANYDIGHVFSTGGGGIAYLGCVCQAGTKARGVTGSGAPIGDPFDIDYVAHEMGHQFDANHTFNGTTSSCGGGNRNGGTAYEPGSGSTIMAYAGICGTEDLQPHSDDYFHTISFDEIAAYTTGGGGSGCAVTAATGNNPPAISAGPDYTIPKSTPFVLTASGSDPDGDSLTYCWEEFDLGAAAPPNTDNGTRPIFRSFNPTPSPSRTFPRLSDILSGVPTLGESLPATTRTMKFRITARDNRSGGGGVDYDLAQVAVVGTAGPFAITSPNTAVNWGQGTSQTVTWNVAGTTGSGINTANVNILLSVDGGYTWPYTLAASTANDGSENISVPIVSTATARIKVEAAGNIFFDINDANFAISVGGCPTITLSPPSMPGGTVGTFYSQTVTAGGGTAPYGYQRTSGTLPNGLNISSGGVISGTPTTAGTFNFTVTATDAAFCTGSRAYSIEVTGSSCPAITINPPSLPGGSVGAAYSQTIAASGGTAPYSYSVQSGSLPPNLTLSPGGVISGTSATAGLYSFTVLATDSAACTGSRPYTLNISGGGCQSILVSPETIAAGTVGTAYSQNFTAAGGAAPYVYSIAAGTPPPGLDLDSAGVLSGTPTAAGEYIFTVAARDTSYCTGTRDYTLTISSGGAYLYYDDFEDGNAGDWRASSGTWSVVGGDLRGTASRKSATILSPYPGSGAFTVETEMWVNTAGATAGLLSWYTDSKNYVQLLMSDASDRWTIEQYSGGKRVASKSKKGRIAPGTRYKVSLIYDGSKFRLLVNGRSRISINAARPASGTVGFRVQGNRASASFEEIKVRR
ncbi:MAG: putative Ig domain-containing protein [Acidobacteriota bacterium]